MTTGLPNLSLPNTINLPNALSLPGTTALPKTVQLPTYVGGTNKSSEDDSAESEE